MTNIIQGSLFHCIKCSKVLKKTPSEGKVFSCCSTTYVNFYSTNECFQVMVGE